MDYIIAAVNPGSTSTKIAVYKNEEQVFSESVSHPAKEIERFDGIMQQLPFRLNIVREVLSAHGTKPEDLSCVMGRGGMLPPMRTGGYLVTGDMLELLQNGDIPQHASNLGGVLAHEIAEPVGIPAYIYDAVSSNEFPPIAKITGLKQVTRKSFCHVLNTRAAARKYASHLGRRYEDLRLIVTHLGSGITAGVHCNGRLIDTIADDNGPFAPERAGSLPLLDVIDICYSGKYNRKEMKLKIRGLGGLRDLLGTSDGRKIAQMLEGGDEYAALVMQAQAYQIAKGIALLTPALEGNCDAIILTGGLAHMKSLTEDVKKYVGWIAPFVVMPGEFEMEALCLGGMRILRGQECARVFKYENGRVVD
jgi:butyrate kinase